MRTVFWLVAVFAAAVALALAGRLGEGYVLLVYPPWRVEISMLLAILALLAGFAGFTIDDESVGDALAGGHARSVPAPLGCRSCPVAR